MASSADRISVIVIGAGVAGLTVASKLIKNPEFDVVVLEAAKRIGGRVYSYKLGNNMVEMGAQWIHGEKDNSAYALAQPFGLLAEETDNRKFGPSAIFVTQSGEFLAEGIHDKVMAVMEKLHIEDGVEPEKVPLGQYASRVFWNLNDVDPVHEKRATCQGVLDWLHRFQNSIDGSDNWFVPSCQGQVEYKSCDGNPTIPWKAPAAYSSLFDLILYGEPRQPETPETIIPDWIHLNKEVIEVHYSSTGNKRVTVTCRDGSSYMADHVICTVSLGVLKHHHAALFHPMLPREKVAAIEHIEFGSVDKIYITFETPWWPENTVGFNLIWEDSEAVQENWLAKPSNEVLASERDGIPIWCRSLLGFYPVKNTTNTLVSWITGPPARFMEKMSPCDLKRDLVTVLNKFLGGIHEISKVTDVTPSKWHTNPFTRGSYSFRSVESENKNVWAMHLAEPIKDHSRKPVVCFAGEATHSHYYSTVHGAYDTGIREAERLSEYYRKLRQRNVDDDYPYCCTLLPV